MNLSNITLCICADGAQCTNVSKILIALLQAIRQDAQGDAKALLKIISSD